MKDKIANWKKVLIIITCILVILLVLRNLIGESFLRLKVWIQFENQTVETFSNEDDSVEFAIKTLFGEMEYVEEVSVFVLFDENVGYEEYKCYSQGGNIYSKKITRDKYINQPSLHYYFVVDNGIYEVVSEEGVMHNIDTAIDNEYNVQEYTVLSGVEELVTTEEQLWFDGVDVTKDAYGTVAGRSVVIFDAAYTDAFFKNVVSVEGEVLGVFDEGTYDSWQTYIYEIGTAHLNQSNLELTVEIHAGNKANLLEHNIENNDDFLLRNIHMVLPDGEMLYPICYQAAIGVGEEAYQDIEQAKPEEVLVGNCKEEIMIGDAAGSYEILYVTFALPEEVFDAICYEIDTMNYKDGIYEVHNGQEGLDVKIDNTPPDILCNIEDGAVYEGQQLYVAAADAMDQKHTALEVWVDGKKIPDSKGFTLEGLGAGTHTLWAVASDGSGNTQEKHIAVEIPYAVETVYDEGYQSVVSLGMEDTVLVEREDCGYPVEQYELTVDESISVEDFIEITWVGVSNNQKTSLQLYNYSTNLWDVIEAKQLATEDEMTLSARVEAMDYCDENQLQIKIQNGEGYYTDNKEVKVEEDVYDFTFVTQSDTQYYNEDFKGNRAKKSNGNYTCQLAINNWIVENKETMNIAYMFHDGDIIDDYDVKDEWLLSDAAYEILDRASIPYGVLAGNHDVGHLLEDYTAYTEYFGESRYRDKEWYGGSFENNKGHYDLITVGDVDFIMLYMGWGVGDEEIKWLNYVLEQYPERNAILNFHEYLLASGGMGEEAKRIREEVVATHSNVIMVQSGHYHNALTKIDRFVNADGSSRYVYNLLFDYQGLAQGGMGYIRLLHFDIEEMRVLVETYSPYLNDYNAKSVLDVDPYNAYVIPGADEEIMGRERFELNLQLVGAQVKEKVLETKDLNIDIYKKMEELQEEELADGNH